MIEEYLRRLDEILSTSPSVTEVEVVRRSVRDSELEKTSHYRYRIRLVDGGLVEMTERLLEARGTLRVTMYRHHWQDRNGSLVRRWDNAPHHPEIETFPHHLHDGAEDRVVAHSAVTGLEVLQRIVEELEVEAPR
jgi:hypothetical protein